MSSLLGCLPGAGAGAGVLRLEPYFAIGTWFEFGGSFVTGTWVFALGWA